MGGAREGAGRPRKNYLKTSVSVSPDGNKIWLVAAQQLGLQKSGALEIILRDYARQHGIEIEAEGLEKSL